MRRFKIRACVSAECWRAMQLKDENNSKITEGSEEETTDNKELPLTVSPV